MAHVVVELNKPFSRRLQIEVGSENVYGGTIGIYWPDATGRRSFFLGKEFERSAEIKQGIKDEIRTALLHRRPLYRCTWAAAKELESSRTLEHLKASGSKELDKYIEVFDEEKNPTLKNYPLPKKR